MKVSKFIPICLITCLALIGCSKRTVESKPVMQVRLDNLTMMDERTARQATAREFLWNHWRARQPATLELTFISKEGKRTDSKFDVNLMPGSTLILHVSNTRYRYGYNGQVFKQEEPGRDIYTVERVLRKDACYLDANAKVRPVANDATMSGGEYCLRFRGWGDSFEGSF